MVTDEMLRQELAAMAPTPKNAVSYLACFLVLGGELSLGGSSKLTISLRNNASALLAAQCLHLLYGYRPEVGFSGGADKRRSRRVVMELPEKITKLLLTDCRMLQVNEAGQAVYVLGLNSMRWVDKPAYFAALYLECGRLYTSDNYRLDIVAAVDARRLREWEGMLNGKHIKYLVREESGKVRFSFRNEAVAAFMALLGASSCSLQVTDFYVERDVNRSLNRAVNCTTSNMDKVFKAAAYQLWAIKLLQDVGAYNLLSREVRLVGDARLANPDSSMQRLSEITGVNKTAVYRRMKVITDAAEQHKGE